jgi:hypothetical protein
MGLSQLFLWSLTDCRDLWGWVHHLTRWVLLLRILGLPLNGFDANARQQRKRQEIQLLWHLTDCRDLWGWVHRLTHRALLLQILGLLLNVFDANARQQQKRPKIQSYLDLCVHLQTHSVLLRSGHDVSKSGNPGPSPGCLLALQLRKEEYELYLGGGSSNDSSHHQVSESHMQHLGIHANIPLHSTRGARCTVPICRA